MDALRITGSGSSRRGFQISRRFAPGITHVVVEMKIRSITSAPVVMTGRSSCR